MQESLFISETYKKPEVYAYRDQGVFSESNIRLLQLQESEYTRWYCVREILTEQYLWDMRCWDKPKYQYSKEEIISHIQKWIKDHEEGNWTNNCGHCLYCIRRLLDKYDATIEEISDLVLRNNNIKYYNQIETWNNGYEETLEDIGEVSDCPVN
jgi:hypothetical protein